MKFKKPKSVLSKTEKVAGEMKATKKRKDTSANLGHYLHAAKMPTGSKIGAASTSKKTTKAKMLNKRAQKGLHLNVCCSEERERSD
jgi:hypothetical protein